MCSICDAKIAEAQTKARDTVSASAEKFCQILEGRSPSQAEVEQWIRDLSLTILAVVSSETLTEMLLSVPPHGGDSTPTSH